MTDLVLLPGTLCDERLFAHLIETIGDETNVVVGNLTTSASIPGMASDVIAAAPDQFALVGLSLGGLVAMDIVSRVPERVTRLALLDTNPHLVTDAQIELWAHLEEETRAGRFESVFDERIATSLHHRDDPTVAATVRAMALDMGPEAFLNQNTAQPTRTNTYASLSQIDCPTIVLCGEHDKPCPVEFHETIADLIPGADLVVIPDAGHLSPLDQPERVTKELVAWLDHSDQTTDTKENS